MRADATPADGAQALRTADPSEHSYGRHTALFATVPPDALPIVRD
ncbi:hypothetical protein [Dactylosporangium cerinum]